MAYLQFRPEPEYNPSGDLELIIYAYQHSFDPETEEVLTLAQLVERGLLPERLAEGRHRGYRFRGGVLAPNLDLCRELKLEFTWQGWAYTWPEVPKEGETYALYRCWHGYPYQSTEAIQDPPPVCGLSREERESYGWYVIDYPSQLRTGPFWAENKEAP